jgi:tetratricopeptide (TPR) repeat protein
MKRSLITLALLGVTAWATPAAAGNPDYETCAGDDPAASIAACTRVIDSGAEHGEFLGVMHGSRGLSYFRLRDYPHAIHDFDVVIATARKADYRRDTFRARGMAHYFNGDYARAVADYTAAMPPPDAVTLGNRGLARLKLHDFAAARRDYDAALALKPDVPQALFGRGLAAYALGNKAAADRDFAAARKLFPGVDDIFKGEGFVLPP